MLPSLRLSSPLSLIFVAIEKSLGQWHLLPSLVGTRVVANRAAARISNPKSYRRRSNLSARVIQSDPSHGEACLFRLGISFIANLTCLRFRERCIKSQFRAQMRGGHGRNRSD